jgi:cytochrome c
MRRPALLLCSIAWLSGGCAAAAGAQDAAAGETVFKRFCVACHSVEAGKNKIGPALFGVIGRTSGTAPGFVYSDSMKRAAIVWSAETLDKYLADPKGLVPANKMIFAGVKKPEERQALISYLATLH